MMGEGQLVPELWHTLTQKLNRTSLPINTINTEKLW